MLQGIGAGLGKMAVPTNITVRDRLVTERESTKKRLEDINKAIKLLNKNTDVEDLLNILTKLQY